MNVVHRCEDHGISASLLFRWKKLMKDGGMSAIESGDEVVS
ncbi:transposase, partial [Marinobacter segnicrescens]